MKKLILSTLTIILFSTVSSFATSLPGDDVDVKFDKKGNIAVISTKDIKQIRCFNDDGKKMILDIDKSRKDVRLANNLDKGVWYFQVRTTDGEVSIKKLDIK